MERARVPSVHLILSRIAAGDPSDAVLLAGDFNASPSSRTRRLFAEAGLASSAALAGERGAPTYQFYGIRLRSLDDLLINRGWVVRNRQILDMKPGNTFPSDHFGVMADLRLREETPLEHSKQ